MSPTKSHFQLKGSLFTLTTFLLESGDLAGIEQQLSNAIKQAPKFFDNTPLVIDLKKFSETGDIHFPNLLTLLRGFKLIPIGIRGGTPQLQQQAAQAGMAILPEEKKAAVEATPAPAPQPVKSKTKLITIPIRSGQQIYAQGGDLIVLAPVSVGSELLADGNIHVYGPLRGRALAGVLGDTTARIFCSSLEAELVSIAGQYKVSEQLKEFGWKAAVNIELLDGNLKIHNL
jgi:septum site-determining protein MinC